MSDGKDFILFVGNLSDKITEKLLYELFLQAGPVEDVTVKKGFGFITFTHHESIPYTLKLFEGIQLFGRTLALKPRDGSMYANSMKDIRRSRSMNEFPAVGPSSSFNTRDNRPHQNMHMHPNSMKKVSSLSDINIMKAGGRGGANPNQPWSSGPPETMHHSGNYQGKQVDYSSYDRSNYSQDGSNNFGGNLNMSSGSVGDYRDGRSKMDGKHSSKGHNVMHERTSGFQNNSFGNRNNRDSPSNRDYDSRHHGNIRRDTPTDRNVYFDRKNQNTGGFVSSPQDSWNRGGGNRSFGASGISPAAQNFDRNSNRRNSNSNFPPRNREHGQYRPHHEKPYNRQHNAKYSMDGGNSKGGYNAFGNGGRRQ